MNCTLANTGLPLWVLLLVALGVITLGLTAGYLARRRRAAGLFSVLIIGGLLAATMTVGIPSAAHAAQSCPDATSSSEPQPASPTAVPSTPAAPTGVDLVPSIILEPSAVTSDGAGEQIITITNRSTTATSLAGAQFTAPKEVDFYEVESIDGVGWTLDDETDDANYVLTFAGVIEPGASVSVTMSVYYYIGAATGTHDFSVTIPVGSAGDTDSTNNGASAVLTYTTAPSPDLTPAIVLSPSSFTGTTQVEVTVSLSEIANIPTDGSPVRLAVTKQSLFSNPVFSSSQTTNAAGLSVQNNLFTLDATSNPNYYLFTASGLLLQNDTRSLVFTLTGTPGDNSGTSSESVVVTGGGDATSINNVAVAPFSYFSQFID